MGPSVTTYSNYNMGYRIYIIDGDYAETTNVSLLVTAIQCCFRKLKLKLVFVMDNNFGKLKLQLILKLFTRDQLN